MKKSLSYISLFVAVLTLSLFQTFTTWAQTDVSGQLKGSIVWTKAGSPYRIVGDVAVDSSSTLTIQPGVEVIYMGNYELLIMGGSSIIANGTPADSIVFRSYSQDMIIQSAFLRFFQTGLSGQQLSYIKMINSRYGIMTSALKTPAYLTAETGGTLNVSNFRFIKSSITPSNSDGQGSIFHFEKGRLEQSAVAVGEFSEWTSFDDVHFEKSSIYGGTFTRGIQFSNCFINKSSYSISMRSHQGSMVNTVVLNSTIYTSHDNVSDLFLTNCKIINCGITNNGVLNATNTVFASNDSTLISGVGDVVLNHVSVVGNTTITGIHFNDRANGILHKFEYVTFSRLKNVFLNSNMYGNIATNTLTNSNFYNINYRTILNNSKEGFSAKNSWWGTSNTGLIDLNIFDKKDDATKGEVDYSGFLSAPDTSAPVAVPARLIKKAVNGGVLLSWLPNPESDLAGYRLYFGSFNGYEYSQFIDLGLTTSHFIPGASINANYAITAYDQKKDNVNDQVEGHESWFADATLSTENNFGLNTTYCIYDAPKNLSASPAGGVFSGPGVQNGSFNPATAGAGSHTLKYVYPYSNTINDTLIATVNVIAAPVVNASSPNAICWGSSVTLTASGATNYTWLPGNLTGSVVAISPTVTTSYSVIGTVAGGCSGTAQVIVTVNPLPTLYVMGSTSICPGTPLSLTATGASTYTWETLSHMNVASGPVLTVPSLNASSSYVVTGSTPQGCTTSQQVEVTVAPLPTPVIQLDGPNSLCKGDSIALFGPAGYDQYWWSGGPEHSNTNTLRVGSNTNYSLRVRKGGCVSEESPSVFIWVNLPPFTPTIDVNLSATKCKGDENILIANSPSIFNFPDPSYIWSTGETTQSIRVKTAGSYWVKAVNECGISAPTNQELFFVSTPKPVITASGPTTFCEGTSVHVNLTATGGPGMNWTNFIWSTGANTETITVTAPGKYYVKLEDYCGINISDTVEIKMISAPTTPQITVYGNTTFCKGDSVQLAAPAGYNAYLWSNGETKQTIVVKTSGTFSVKVSSSCGSATSAVVNTRVLPAPVKPVIIVNGSLKICPGSGVGLFAPTGFTSYLWSNGATTRYISVYTAGTFSVKCTGPCGPIMSDPVNVELLPIKIEIKANGSLTFCAGTSVELVATPGYTSYLWSNGATTQSINVNTGGTFYVKGTGPCGTFTSPSVTTKVLPAPAKPVIIVNGSLKICPGSGVGLFAPTGFTSYLWSNGATTRYISVYTAGTYSVKCYSSCGPISSDPVIVEVLPNTTKPVITANGPTTFSQGSNVTLNATSGYLSYLWSTGETTQAITVNTSGKYSVKGTGTCGAATSSPVTVSVVSPAPATLAKKEETISTGIEYSLESYPNPFQLSTTLNFSVANTGNVKLTVMNMNGQEITVLYDQQAEKDQLYKVVLHAAEYNLKPGIYLCRMTTAQGDIHFKKLLLME